MEKPLFENKILSRKIVEYKAKHNLTYQDLGEAIGVDKSYLNRVVKMSSHMSMPVLIRLAKFMGLPLYALFIPTEEMIREEFITEVQAVMKKENLSVEKIAEKTGLSPVQVMGIVEGNSPITRKEHDLLISALGIGDNPYQNDNLELIETLIKNLSLSEIQKENTIKYIKENLL